MAATRSRSSRVPLPGFGECGGSGDARCLALSLACKDYELDSVGVGTQILNLRRHS